MIYNLEFVKPKVIDDIEEDEIEEPVGVFVDTYFCDKRPRT